MHFCTSALHCTPSHFDRPKDVYGCSAAPEEFAPTAFLVLLLLCFAPNVWGDACGPMPRR